MIACCVDSAQPTSRPEKIFIQRPWTFLANLFRLLVEKPLSLNPQWGRAHIWHECNAEQSALVPAIV